MKKWKIKRDLGYILPFRVIYILLYVNFSLHRAYNSIHEVKLRLQGV